MSDATSPTERSASTDPLAENQQILLRSARTPAGDGGRREKVPSPLPDLVATQDFTPTVDQTDTDANLSQSSTDTSLDKQVSDLAFAAALVRSGKVKERQLERAVKDWTVFGNQSLAEQLVRNGILTEEEISHWQAEARKLKDSVNQSVAEDPRSQSMSLGGSQMLRIDGSGRLAKLLGLGHSSEPKSDDNERGLITRFSLVRKIGEGGLGTVWLARDENLRRYVAIKEIRNQNDRVSASTLARFRREAEVTGRLEHPGIVPIYEFGTDIQTGRFFYVMRFMGKQTMQNAISEYHELRETGNDDPLILHRLISAFVELCNSVAYAHSKQVIHRDLKPENVALDSFGQVILLDWGLAKINDDTGAAEAAFEIGDDEIASSNLTLASQVLGSPMYMAPEQASGHIELIDERTDVYGLGGILFAILTGQSPHEPSHDSSVNVTFSELLTEIVSGKVVHAKEVVPTVPPELDAICFRALQKKRCLRYPSASALAEDLERYMAGRKVSAYKEPSRRKVSRWVSEHPKWSQFIGVASVVLILVIFISTYLVRQNQKAAMSHRFQQAADVVKELAFHMQAQAEDGIKDARFLASLPAVQQIIEGAHDSPPTAATESIDASNRSEMQNRFASIAEALLHRNQSYHSIEMIAFARDQAKQITRVERNVGTGLVRRVPEALLSSFTIDEQNATMASLMPGDVLLNTSDKTVQGVDAEYNDSLALTVTTSVYDQRNDVAFGLLVIQLDLRGLMRDRIESTRRDGVNVYIADGNGLIQMVLSEGVFRSHYHGKPIATLAPDASRIFGGTTFETSYSDETSLYAKRVRLGERISKSSADVGVVVQVHN
ncbi:serine/threonine-protein kinase [Neorhodopirellula pilleata]|uniref:Serine/threonine-protein kinase PknB n=1 Tax=Neorhodopirellula pilleata TaxID=2714738 RepID=A0A5C6APX8_9BACT|nr:serine/threonine-protein kinase [Neorhodopirellula pilleata]TWU02005.1 Serine/threonine-protein kinase PknB [Neorhodopirellula pilleata]